MTEFKKNTFDEEDMRSVLSEFEEMNDEAEELMASARGKVAGLRKKQKELKRRAKDDLGIPSAILNPILRQRNLERQMRKNAAEVAEEWTEVFEEASGQFSLFAPDDNEKPEEAPAAQRAARQRKKEAKEANEHEQAEGERIIDEMMH
jgi:hypothetical protein